MTPKLSSAGLKFRGAASSVLAGRDTNRRSLARTPQDEPEGSAAPPASRVASKKNPAQRGALVTHSLLARCLKSVATQGVDVGYARIAAPHGAGSGVPFIRLGRVCGI